MSLTYILMTGITVLMAVGIVIALVFIFLGPTIRANRKLTENVSNLFDGNAQNPAISKQSADLIGVPGNVIFYVDGGVEFPWMGFFNFRVDGAEPVQVFPRMPVGVELEPGVHTVLVAYPRSGNEMYPARIQMEVNPGIKYAVLYTYPTIKFAHLIFPFVLYSSMRY